METASKNLMDDSDAKMKVTPLKKKRVLKHVKKKIKAGLNSSVSKKKTTGFNFSLSTSIHKQTTLRANNRALAYNLERTKEELRSSNEVIIELRRENQELVLKNTTLQRVVGLKNEEIDVEVQRRIESYVQEVKALLGKMGQHLFDTSSCLGEAMDKCVQLSRPSIGGSSRCSSIGNTTVNSTISEDVDSEQSVRRSLYYEPPKKPALSIPSSEPDLTNVHEMSIIAEQSILLENITPPAGLISGELTDLIEGTCESAVNMVNSDKGKCGTTDIEPKDKILSYLPQRVPKHKKSEKSNETDLTAAQSTERINLDSQDFSDDITSEILQDKIPTEKSIIGKFLSKGENKKEEMHDDDVLKKRKTFNVPKTPEVIKKKCSSSEDTKSAEISENNKKDRRGTFVVKKDSLNNVKDKLNTIKDRRGTFVVAQASENTSSDDNSAAPVKKDRRGTFVLSGNEAGILKDKMEEKMDEGEMPDDDMTQFFNTDMEFTEVLSEKIDLSNLSNNSKETSKTQLDKQPSKEQFSDSKNIATQSSDVRKSQKSRSKSSKEESVNSHMENKKLKTMEGLKPEVNHPVEFRLPKPGKIVFSASRKEIDGTRKPVPTKIPIKPVSRSKVKVSKTKDPAPDVTPAKITSIFDFHDKTPTVTIESKASSSVYDLSLNESVVCTKQSLNELRDKSSKEKEHATATNLNSDSTNKQMEKDQKNQKTESKKNNKVDDGKMLPSGPVYYLPLKGCSDDESPKKISQESSESGNEKEHGRSRSRSRKRKNDTDSNVQKRTRSRSRQVSCDDDGGEEWVPESRGRSRSRSKPSKNSEMSDEDNDRHVPKARGRSRTRSKSAKSDDEDVPKSRDSSKVCVQDSSEEEVSSRVSRSRTRSRTRPIESENKDIEEGIKRRTRSQSRRRPVNVETDEEAETLPVNENQKSKEENGKVQSPRGRSRTTDTNDIDNGDRKSRGRTRSCVRDIKASELTDHENTTGGKEEQAVVTDVSEDKKNSNTAREQTTRSRSRVRMRKLSTEGNEDDANKESRSRSRNRKGDQGNGYDEDELCKHESEIADNEVLRTKRSNTKNEKLYNLDDVRNREKKTETRSKSRTRNKSTTHKRDNEGNCGNEKMQHESIDAEISIKRQFESKTPIKNSKTTEKKVEKSVGKSRSKRKKNTENDVEISDIVTRTSEYEKQTDTNSKNRLTVPCSLESDQQGADSEKCLFVTKRGRSMKIVQNMEDSFAEFDLGLNSVNALEPISVDDLKLPKDGMLNDKKDSDHGQLKSDRDDINEIPETPKNEKSSKIKEVTAIGGENAHNVKSIKGLSSSSEVKGQSSKSAIVDSEESHLDDIESKRPITKSVKKSAKKRTQAEKSQENNEKSDAKTEKENISGTNRFEDLKRRLASLGGGTLEGLSHRNSDCNTTDDKVLCDVNSSNNSEISDDGGEPAMKRSRRAAGQVSYKEPSLGGKLRRGDAFTNNFFKTENIYKSPRTKNRKSVPRKHSILEDSIVESSAE